MRGCHSGSQLAISPTEATEHDDAYDKQTPRRCPYPCLRFVIVAKSFAHCDPIVIQSASKSSRKPSTHRLQSVKNAASAVLERRRGKWWAWQGLNLRPLRCQHSALPLSYTPTLIFKSSSRSRMTRREPSGSGANSGDWAGLQGPMHRASAARYKPSDVTLLNAKVRSTSATRSFRWKGLDRTLALGMACPALSDTAENPVMNMTFMSA